MKICIFIMGLLIGFCLAVDFRDLWEDWVSVKLWEDKT